MASSGADFIICQHSHCIGAIEEYHGSKILYGQGNFILDSFTKAYAEFFMTGLLVKISAIDEGFDWELIPIVKQGAGVRKATIEEGKAILDGLYARSAQIIDEHFVRSNYKVYAVTEAPRLAFRLTRFGYILSAIDNRFFDGKLLKKNIKVLMGRHQRLALQNCLQCEVHNELLREYLDE